MPDITPQPVLINSQTVTSFQITEIPLYAETIQTNEVNAQKVQVVTINGIQMNEIITKINEIIIYLNDNYTSQISLLTPSQ